MWQFNNIPTLQTFRPGLSNAAPAGAMVPATYFPGARDILSWHPILLCQL
jgi:hypothetical protein